MLRGLHHGIRDVSGTWFWSHAQLAKEVETKMTLKRYAELGTVHRNEPCREYPGEWIVYVNGNESSKHNAFDVAFHMAQEASDKAQDLSTEVSVCWSCSDNDPRIGEVWFTSFYRHGKFDYFGRYKS